MSPKFSASLMCADLLNLENEIKLLKKLDYIHIDIMDNKFVSNITFGFDVYNTIAEKLETPLDLHLMAKDPVSMIQRLAIRPGDILTIHIECERVSESIDIIKSKGAKIGLAINPTTPIKKLAAFMKKVDLILVMTVTPGFAGGAFVEDSYLRVNELNSLSTNIVSPPMIGVDGAIGEPQITEFYSLGVRHFVLGTTALFNGKNLSKQIVALNSLKEMLSP